MNVGLDFVRKGVQRYSKEKNEMVGASIPMETKEEAVKNNNTKR